ncbi:MAG: polyprenol monophosphomannose synthase [Candidatus Kerfeldbacteria bacterium]|nr:polyprenol monophosphomannose synthase [Candidatus Kerfeldbacteria bacterium]
MLNTWMIVPTYNEAANLPSVLARIAKLEQSPQVLIVDDNSPDGTGRLADELRLKYEFLHVLHRQSKLGLGSAYRAGFHYALEHGAEAVGEMDADLSHAPEDIPRLVQAVAQGAEVAIGSRRVPGGRVVGWSWWRHLESWGAMTVARLLLKLKARDVTSGFRLYTKQVLDKIPWAQVKSDGYAWQEEILFLCERTHLKIIEVPVVFVDRKFGATKLSLDSIFEFFITLLRLRFFSDQRFNIKR